MSVEKHHIVFGISLCAGAMDATTGLLLVAAPTVTLGLFGASLPGGGDIMMRFVGAFVAGIGTSYLWGIASKQPVVRMRRLFGVWGATALARGGVALFTTTAVIMGPLEPHWLVVGLTDATLAIVQTMLICRGWFDRKAT